ncbi:hypothetical protein ACFSTC_02645 [Nonomuraea ferruginea]
MRVAVEPVEHRAEPDAGEQLLEPPVVEPVEVPAQLLGRRA